MQGKFEFVLSHFHVVNRRGDTVQCRCPAHDDAHASLTVSMGEKGVLIFCHAGCSLENILDAAGLRMQDLFFYDLPQSQEKWRAFVEGREKRRIEAVYTYKSIVTGETAFTKLRLEGKKLLYGRIENNRFIYGLPRSTPRKSLKAVYGNLADLQKASA